MSELETLTERRFKDGFRETFVFLFTRKGDAPTFRHLAALLMDLYRGVDPRFWPEHQQGDFYGLILAALRDLRHVRDVFLWIDGGHGFNGYEAAVADLVGQCGADLEMIAQKIEAGMANLPNLFDEYMRAMDERAGMRPRDHYEPRDYYGGTEP